MKNKVAIIGHGVVGKGMNKIFPDALIYDPKYFICQDRNNVSGDTFMPMFQPEEWVNATTKKRINEEAGLAIICVPSPMKEDGSCDTSIVEEAVNWLETPLILIKSTIAPGTTDYLRKKYQKRICFSPEYAGESKYYTPPEYPDPNNMLQHSFMVIGGEQENRKGIIDIFAPIFGPTKKYYQCDAKEAELIKYFENAYFATKVTFANEMKSICNAFDVDYYKVREGWLLDSRICPMHTLALEGQRGWNGKCFPKDINAIVKASEAVGYEPKLIKEVLASNERFRGMSSSIDSSSTRLKNVEYVNN